MLVLTRKLDEQIVIGDDIKITLIRVRGNTVRLGIEAPRDVRIVRSELEPIDDQPAEDDQQIDDREEAFAHPVANRRVSTPQVACDEACDSEKMPQRVDAKRRPMNRITSGSTPAVFVGRVARDGSQPQLKRAPLSSYVSVAEAN